MPAHHSEDRSRNHPGSQQQHCFPQDQANHARPIRSGRDPNPQLSFARLRTTLEG